LIWRTEQQNSRAAEQQITPTHRWFDLLFCCSDALLLFIMYAKALALILIATVTAAALVALRQQRLQAAHRMTQTHRRIDTTRQDLWVLQARVSEYLGPRRLEDAITRNELSLQSVTPNGYVNGRPLYLANRREGGDGWQ
jgi:hypothetical protein